MKYLPKLLVIGHGRHGKDTVCEYLNEKYGFDFKSSSKFCSERFIFDMLKDGMKIAEEMEEEWYNAICDYNVPDPARLGREIFAAHDIYCGLRNKKEFHAMKNTGVFDYAIWVDRSDYLPIESKDSMSLEQWMADYTIDNNGTPEDLHFNINELMHHILK